MISQVGSTQGSLKEIIEESTSQCFMTLVKTDVKISVTETKENEHVSGSCDSRISSKRHMAFEWLLFQVEHLITHD